MNSIKSSLEVDDTELQRKNKLNNATNLNDLYIDRCRGVQCKYYEAVIESDQTEM